MHTPRPSPTSSPRVRFAWLQPVVGLAILIVSLFHVWEVMQDILRHARRRH